MMIETLASGYALLEGPVWDPVRGLIVADAEQGGVRCFDAAGRVETLWPHRTGIGGIVRHVTGGIVVSGRNVAHRSRADAPSAVLLDSDPERGVIGFNDITTDARGRIYAGSLGYRPRLEPGRPRPGRLHLLDLDGTARVVAEGIGLSNGLGFSADGSQFFQADTQHNVVYVYDVGADGSLSNRRDFVRPGAGRPDGLALARDGSLWLAAVWAGLVIVYHPDGRERRRLAFPVPMITSLCFGGPDLRDLYVVSGSDNSGRKDAGSIFHLRVEVPGVPVAPARVALRQAP
ncbi:MAG: SMP-30/gluconolactonase/LRE family protein [Alphaproteobacteria bacterium]|nr:SMP-30/gluconolactonase/LRE family protein [Alphaproteobacteria bacterium]